MDTEPRIFSDFFGGIRKIWVALPGCPARCVADEFDHLTREQLIARARVIQALRQRRADLIAQAESEFPGFCVFVCDGEAPCEGDSREGDIRYPAGFPGDAVLVLSKRRKRGKYEVVKFYPFN